MPLADHEAELVARHLDPDGRLQSMPAKPARRLLVLRHIAEALPVGQELDEFAVNQVLRQVDDDVATLRRFLVDAGLLERPRPGWYVRPAPVPPAPLPPVPSASVPSEA